MVLYIHLIFPVKRLVALAIKAVIFFCAGISNHFFHCIFEYVFPCSKGRFEIIRSTGISFPSSRTLYTCIPFTNSSKMRADFVYGIEIFLNQHPFASVLTYSTEEEVKNQGSGSRGKVISNFMLPTYLLFVYFEVKKYLLLLWTWTSSVTGSTHADRIRHFSCSLTYF